MNAILELQMDNEMPCFDCKNVIFITNKWDTIYGDENDSSEDDQEIKTWKVLLPAIKEQWPLVEEDNIFKMNLKDVSIFVFFYGITLLT